MALLPVRPGGLRVEALAILSLIISILSLTISLVVGYFQVLFKWDQISRDFRVFEPDVRIGRLSILSSRLNYSVNLWLHNFGKTPAYDLTATLDGWPGNSVIQTVYPLHPGYNEYQVNMELERDSPIRTTSIESAKLWIRYRDRWNYDHELSYPVIQTPQADDLFGIHIQDDKPTHRKPELSLFNFFEIRSHLRKTPTP